MIKWLTILPFVLISWFGGAQDLSEFSFHAENEDGVMYYTLQCDSGNGFKDVLKIPVGSHDYDLHVPYVPGLYRLRTDENNSYSNIVVVRATTLRMTITIDRDITLHISSPTQEVTASLYDIVGRLLNHMSFVASGETEEQMPKPAAGIYIIRLQSATEMLIQKLKIL